MDVKFKKEVGEVAVQFDEGGTECWKFKIISEINNKRSIQLIIGVD